VTLVQAHDSFRCVVANDTTVWQWTSSSLITVIHNGPLAVLYTAGKMTSNVLFCPIGQERARAVPPASDLRPGHRSDARVRQWRHPHPLQGRSWPDLGQVQLLLGRSVGQGHQGHQELRDQVHLLSPAGPGLAVRVKESTLALVFYCFRSISFFAKKLSPRRIFFQFPTKTSLSSRNFFAIFHSRRQFCFVGSILVPFFDWLWLPKIAN